MDNGRISALSVRARPHRRTPYHKRGCRRDFARPAPNAERRTSGVGPGGGRFRSISGFCTDRGSRLWPTKLIVETRNLTKIYRDFWGRQKKTALHALNLKIHRGEIFGLLGPNGSGKTTTIKLLLGLLFPTDGEAFVFGEPAADVSKNERIGYLPEESYLYRFLNAEETLDFYGRLFNIAADVRRKRAAGADREGRPRPPTRSAS